MRIPFVGVLLLFLLAGSTSAITQPDISAIGDFRVFTGDFKNPDGTDAERNGNLNMNVNELELAFTGYLNPYARADIFVANHGDGFEIEEAYASILRGLPLNSQIRAGRYLVDFGKLNTFHPHAFPFIDRPITHRVFFGFDGFVDEGVNVNFLLPTSFYSKLSLNLLRGKIFESDAHGHEEEGEEDEHEGLVEGRNTEDPIFTGRLGFFLPVGERGNLEFGFSGLYGKYAGAGAEGSGVEEVGFDDMTATMGGFDLKYKHRWSDYTSLVLHGEIIAGNRDRFVEDELDHAASYFDDVTAVGGFAFADFRFFKQYNAGIMFDYAPGVFDHGEHDYSPIEEFNNTPAAVFDDDNRTTAVTLFAGFSLLEETTVIRLAGRWMTYDINDPSRLVNTELTGKDDEFSVVFQLIWSLGPHKPHEF